MTELSPAAFAVVDAFVRAHARKSDPSSNIDIAAALRAAADQVVPLQLPPELDTQRPTVAWHAWDAEQQARFALLAIATELEAQ